MKLLATLVISFLFFTQVLSLGGMAGGISQQSLDEGKPWAAKAHGKAMLASNCNYEVSEVTKYSTQVVSGVLYRVSYKINSNNGCSEQTCNAEIWSQPWMDKEEVTVKCN